jgi:organic hydroperoxide reductase OsmC/OhrA
MPPDSAIDAEVDLGTTDGGYGLSARLKVSLPGIDRETAQALVDDAEQVCTYSRATRGNVDVTITLV